MRALVTGGCGLIGYHSAMRFLNEGYEVTVMDNLERSNLLGHDVGRDRTYHNWNLLKDAGCEMVKKDVSLATSFSDLPRMDVIVHLAAQCGVPTSIQNPRRDFEVNTI
ncbi:MAG: NAD-dependent epimerase/dehydratase family protein, partial [Candidatus Thorarchaeota archaeon]